jgi:hypothetical protein
VASAVKTYFLAAFLAAGFLGDLAVVAFAVFFAAGFLAAFVVVFLVVAISFGSSIANVVL